MLYMDDIKLFAKCKKRIGNSDTNNENIQPGYWNEIWLRKMESGKREIMEGIEMPHQKRIRTLKEKETFKYFGILEADTIEQVEKKEKIRKEYLSLPCKILGNILKMDKEGTQINGPEDKKINDDAQKFRQTISTKEGGRGLASIEDNVDASIKGLEDYMKKNKKKRLTAATNQHKDKQNNKKNEEIEIGRKTTIRIFQTTNCRNLTRENLDIAKKRETGNLRRETESLIIAAQNNAIRTNHIKAQIYNTPQNCKCRIYSDKNEMINT